VTKSAEMLWLDAIEAQEGGDREGALSLAREVVQIDPMHSEAWMAVAEWGLPAPSKGARSMPNLVQASKSMSAIRRVVSLDPENSNAWSLGGRILVDDLGMLENALEWWEERRKIVPNDMVPLIEQLSILVRLGYYEEGEGRLELLENLEIGPNKSVERKIFGIRRMFDRASKSEEGDVFSPQNEKDEWWKRISVNKNRKPMSETFFLLTFVMPIVFLLGSVAMIVIGPLPFGSIIVMLLIIVLYFTILTLSRGLLDRLNKFAYFLDRAVDVETTTGKTCIPEDIRGSKLYNHILRNRTSSLVERLELIDESGEKVASKWDLEVPF